MENIFAGVRAAEVFATVLYGVIGILLFFLAYVLIEKACPFSVKKEISEDHNVALGIIIGSVMIGLAIIISSAIKG